MLEYKVITQRDKTFSGAFDYEALGDLLNSYAAGGWRLVEGFQAQNIWKSGKAEIVLVLERPTAG